MMESVQNNLYDLSRLILMVYIELSMVHTITFKIFLILFQSTTVVYFCSQNVCTNCYTVLECCL